MPPSVFEVTIPLLSMAPERDVPRRVGRKLTKRRKPERHSSVRYPESLKEGEDVQDDVTAPKGQPAQYVNQSVFSLIAAAGSKVDFNARFDGDSSGSDEEPDPTTIIRDHATPIAPTVASHHRDESIVGDPPSRRDQKAPGPRISLPKLNLRTRQEKDYMSQSNIHVSSSQMNSTESSKGFTPRDAPVMSQMLEAQAQLDASTDLSDTKNVVENDSQEGEQQGRTTLVARLMEIFAFETPEDIIAGRFNRALHLCLPALTHFSEYPCWLLQSVLLQGYLYITQSHLCFYAYLPKKSVSSTSIGPVQIELIVA